MLLAVSCYGQESRLTPGVVRDISTTKVCKISWGKDTRHVTPKMKRAVCIAYGAKDCPGPRWEIDHLIPRELGGADDIRNLWPQAWKPIPGAHEKDLAENYLHGEVCRGKMTLAQAQHVISADWHSAYKVYLQSKEERK